MCLQFGFLIFWRKDFGAKAAHKMLVKLTLVNSAGQEVIKKNPMVCLNGARPPTKRFSKNF